MIQGFHTTRRTPIVLRPLPASGDVTDAPSLNRVIRLTNGRDYLKLACIHAAWEPQHERLKKRNLGLPLTHRRFTRARAAPVQADFRFVSCVLWLFLIAVDPATAVAVAFFVGFSRNSMKGLFCFHEG